MSSHAYHPSLPGYHPDSILHDGCSECDYRAAEPMRAVLNLDPENALKAWQLMRAVRWSGGKHPDREVSQNDYALTQMLYEIAVFLERAGFSPEQVEDGLYAKAATA